MLLYSIAQLPLALVGLHVTVFLIAQFSIQKDLTLHLKHNHFKMTKMAITSILSLVTIKLNGDFRFEQNTLEKVNFFLREEHRKVQIEENKKQMLLLYLNTNVA